MRLHRAHDEVRVARRDVLAIFLLQPVQGRVAVALAVGDVGGLHFPVVQIVPVRVAVAGEAVSEGVLGRGPLGQRGIEQGRLLESGLIDGAVGGVGLIFLLDEELQAARIGADDAEAAAGGLVLLFIDPDGRYGRGSGFSNKEWRDFNSAQRMAAAKLERAAALLDGALETGRGMDTVTRAFEQSFGDATPERMAEVSSTIKSMIGALRDDGSGGFVAHMLNEAEMNQRFDGDSKNTAAGVPDNNRFELLVNRDHPTLLSPENYSWVVGHESAHGVGVVGHAQVGEHLAYRLGSVEQAEAFRILPTVNPSAAIRNPDSIMRFAW